jgi:hypothetical protein
LVIHYLFLKKNDIIKSIVLLININHVTQSKKALLKELFNISRTELKGLMTIFLAIEKRNVISFMSKTGSTYL